MRARNIKPGLFKNDQLAEVDPLGRILFTGLWCVADREGRLEDRPRRIKAEILPYDDCDIEDLLRQLEVRGFVERYTVGGEPFIQIPGFSRHQRPHSSEVASAIPPPGGETTLDGEPTPAARQTKAGDAVNLGVPDGEPREAAPRPDTGYLNADTGSRMPEGSRDDAQSPAPAEQPFELFEVLCEELHVEIATVAPAFKGKQLGIAKKLITEGHTSDQVRRCIRYLRSDDFWTSRGIDLGTVQTQIGKWEVNGEPAAVAVRGSPSGRKPHNPYQAIDDFSEMMDELESHHEARDLPETDAASGRYVSPAGAGTGRSP